eukprot:CAMPEP_0197048240 /NCGR_PEP_ID=MMETSP1384-20130603/23637_1 /TAXON_ID=29189 /ORGANISM="Ammonia sp." /LENGTH=50 /DNA_ID=CAMNT_0042480343 /DNA_START=280 /DNA_END=432 /DNA_ORIENTATION=+
MAINARSKQQHNLRYAAEAKSKNNKQHKLLMTQSMGNKKVKFGQNGIANV